MDLNAPSMQRRSSVTTCSHDTVHRVFEEAVEQFPMKAALVFDGGQWTYSELNRRANQIAHYLLGRGVEAGSRVAVCLDRSPDLIAATLAILKTGGAYVPLDAAYPDDRIAFMLADTGSPVVLTHSDLAGRVPQGSAHVMCLDIEADPISQHKTENLDLDVAPDSLCYVMYTSGSTGTPKGVMIPHRGVVRLVREAGYARFSPEEVFLLHSPVSFDASTFEIWGSLLNGASLAIAPAGALSLQDIGAVIARHRVTTAWLTAGLFHKMVEYRIEDLRPLTQLLAGGDVLSPLHVRTLMEKIPTCALINGYGPTETTTFACCHKVTQADLSEKAIPIGRPINRTNVFIVDSSLEPVPEGEDGELLIGGDGVALGYLNQPELTAAKFIKHSLAGSPNARLYRTGDRCRRLMDGAIDFLGRSDNQVKIAGHRIELGEIETALGIVPGVSQAAVAVWPSDNGEKRLVAYLVAAKDRSLAVPEVRSALAQRLPSFMIPAWFQFVEQLPLSANGKVDRGSLPAPRGLDMMPTSVPQTPNTDLASTVAAVWRKVLRIPEVDAEANFFDLGGDSLMLIEAQAELEKVLGREISSTALFESPSITALVCHLEGKTPLNSGLSAAEERARKQREALQRSRCLRGSVA